MKPLGLPRVHHREINSTNDAARALAAAGAPHGTLVTAQAQSEGRGRQGRVWSAVTGSSLICTVILRDPPALLPLAAGVAVAETLAEFGHDAQLKWPNDVLIEERKVAGILAEGRPSEGWAIVGIGLNVAVALTDLPEELQLTAATMGLGADDVEPVLDTLLRKLSLGLQQSDTELLAAFNERDVLLGRQVKWSGGVGIGAGIDGTGRLIVTGDDGIRHLLDAGEVHLGSIIP
ncbi:MAG: biotin--[acetyl-CoA-carboxylase] ligase [Actinobacteria bacterium]|uniref:Unannotated protein n=1 Tax=freshwater metagenome TaxID=449393 RepID=A0A6J7E9P1_9ZZZZ|nr:biotin--[acetyl-CoA-carboxylase] ligase [Actinomycetota bacterium]